MISANADRYLARIVSGAGARDVSRCTSVAEVLATAETFVDRTKHYTKVGRKIETVVKSLKRRKLAEDALRATFESAGHSGTRGVNGWALYTAYVATRESLEGRNSKLTMHQRSLESSKTADANRRLRHELLRIARGAR